MFSEVLAVIMGNSGETGMSAETPENHFMGSEKTKAMREN